MEKLILDEKQFLNDCLLKAKEVGFSTSPISYFGVFNQDLVNQFTESAENLMISSGEKKSVIKRSFGILIEGLQNSLIHGEFLNENKLVLLVVSQNDAAWRIAIGNVALKENVYKLESFILRLNTASDDEVKEIYTQTLSNGLISEKGGAGLGFITMRLKSKNQLNHSFLELNEDKVFFTIECIVDRATE